MSEPVIETISLEFTARATTSGHLEVEVKNSSGKRLDDKLLIEVQIPIGMVNQEVRAAAERSAKNRKTPNMESLSGVVTAAGGWSVWAFNTSQKGLAAIRAYNYLDQQTGKASASNGRLEADARLTLRVPLIKQDIRAQITILHSYQYGGRDAKTITGSFDLITAGAGECKPQVSLTTDQQSPTMIKPGSSVKIFWNITGGVSAVLRGPMSGGHSELRLSTDRGSDFWMGKGSLEIYATGAATYMLDAEVCGPEGQPNVQVVKMLLLDIHTAGKYANLAVRPSPVLPNGEVEIDWAVWGVGKAEIRIGKRSKLTLNLTEQDLNRTNKGKGIWRVRAKSNDEDVSLTVTNDAKVKEDGKIVVAEWIDAERPVFPGKPVAMAVAVPTLAVMTADDLWLTTVGRDDNDNVPARDKEFRKVSKDTPKARLALAAFDNGYVVLQQVSNFGLQLARYKNNGAQQGSPVDLPDTVKAIVRTSDTIYDLAAFGDRVYVAAQTTDGSQRRAYSVRFDQQEKPRTERWLERLAHYRLITFDGGLYALHRSSGQMLRFDLAEKGELDRPRKAASALYKGQSLVRKGLVIPVGAVLAVLEPEPFQEFSDMRLSDFDDRPECELEKKDDVKPPQETLQDLIYNPQTDEWSPCGHGLKIKPGAAAAYRPGASERLWVLQPDGEMKTLTGASEELFAQDYVDKYPSEPLPPALDSRLEFTLVNQSGINLVPVDDECRAAGLDTVTATSIAELETPPDKLRHGEQKKFTLLYNQGEPGLIWFRFLAERSPGPRYLLELTFSGRGLSSVKSVFKRLAGDRKTADVPETSAQYTSDRPIVVPRAARLIDKKALYILNATNQDLSHHPTSDHQDIIEIKKVEIDYSRFNFRITAPRAEKMGDLWVNFDLALPDGIEMSSRNEAQRSLIRVTTDELYMLDVRVQPLPGGPAPVQFELYDGTIANIPARTDGYLCLIGLKKKQELDFVRLGDAVASPDRQVIYIPVANRERLPNAQVLAGDAGEFVYAERPAGAQGGVFSPPNSVAASKDKVYAVFGDTTLQENDRRLLNSWKKTTLPADYKQIAALTAAANGDVYMVATKDKYIEHRLSSGYYLVAERPPRRRVELSIDNKLSFPVVGPPMAISPDNKTLALCQQGGLLVINVQGDEIKTEHIQVVRLTTAREPAYVTFSHDGAWIYCAHLTRAIGSNPRRAAAGQDMTVSRINVGKLTETTTIPLPDVQGNFGLTGNTRQSFRHDELSKEEVAFSLAVAPDNRSLFVSAGTSIRRIDTGSFTLTQWRKEVELPCRLAFVGEGRGKAWTVYALGSNYVGNGTTVDQYKTHLYAIPAPKS